MAEVEKHGSFGDRFQAFAANTSALMGTKWAFAGAIIMIVLWAAWGPFFHYSDTWQLVVNTGTSIATFLMVFLIQNTQNRDAKAIHLKLDEVIRAIQQAQNEMINIEKLSDDELEPMSKRYESIRLECDVRKRRNG